MKLKHLTFRHICLIILSAMVTTMLITVTALYYICKNIFILYTGFLLIPVAALWIWLLIIFFSKRLSVFTASLCSTLDDMMDKSRDPAAFTDEETLFARILNRLSRLYGIMLADRQRIDEEHQALQELVSDISHQVKTPVSNLKMVTDTLLTNPVTDAERTDFLLSIRGQTDKLDFLMQTMIKSSRLETGIIRLDKKTSRFFDTLAQAVSGIVYPAENKNIEVTVNCPENLLLYHDSKWTAEAIFNILDNAVKYTPDGGKISIHVEQWEIYAKIDIADTGIGIPESSHASIFRRFYREEAVHSEPGVGIGLYLTREIITLQGGYIKVASALGKGSVFSIFLPVK